MENLVNWFKRQINNPQIIILGVILIIIFALIVYAGEMMAPVIAGIVIAYILDDGVKIIEAIKIPRLRRGIYRTAVIPDSGAGIGVRYSTASQPAGASTRGTDSVVDCRCPSCIAPVA